MIVDLAIRNLIYDPIRFSITITGIVFSVLLVAVQLGLYAGSSRMITSAINHAQPDFWVVGHGTQSFEEGPLLPTGRERAAVLSIDGVTSATPMLVIFAYWFKPNGSFTTVLVVGSDPESGGLEPWNLLEGSSQDLRAPYGVAIDVSYFEELGVTYRYDKALIEDKSVRVVAVTKNIRSFTQSPLVFMPLTRARDVLGLGRDDTTFLMVRLAPGTEIKSTREKLMQSLPGVEILTNAEFEERSLTQWLWRTGAGIALIGGSVLGLIVGATIVAQTLYQSIKDNLLEFATLRAIGASSGYLRTIVLVQAGVSSAIGYILGMILVGFVVYGTKDSTLPVVVSPSLAGGILLLTLSMAAIASVAAVIKVLRIDPAAVFFR